MRSLGKELKTIAGLWLFSVQNYNHIPKWLTIWATPKLITETLQNTFESAQSLCPKPALLFKCKLSLCKATVISCTLCTACDISASRKVSGFIGHSGYWGCSRCLKPFPTEKFGERLDYTGLIEVLGLHILKNLTIRVLIWLPLCTMSRLLFSYGHPAKSDSQPKRWPALHNFWERLLGLIYTNTGGWYTVCTWSFQLIGFKG